ncbi:MAG: hypothetical protein LUE14_07510 [Clostridiales bacterium]|nr:hypothetical protein [Clostridiales bacterium]MCD8109931.1 hypothetical protein [Clostridiales bacterium]
MMQVQELFQQADPYRVEEAYFLQHTIFYPYERYSLSEKVDIVIRIKEYIREHVSRLAACEICAEEPQTIFIVGLPCTSYEDKGNTELTLFSIFDTEAFQKTGADFSLWGEEEQRVEHYGIDMCKIESIAGYHIARSSVDTLGIDVCCAEILYQIFEFGYSDKSREKNIQALCERLDEAIAEAKEGKSYSHEEVFDHLWQEMLERCTDEDERQHMILEKEYEDKVEEIERRYTNRILENNHQKLIALVREEYDMRA